MKTRKNPQRCTVTLLQAHAAYPHGTCPRRSACAGSAARSRRQSNWLRIQGDQVPHLGSPFVSAPSPATAANVTRAAGDGQVHSGLGFPFIPGGRNKVLVKELQLLAWTCPQILQQRTSTLRESWSRLFPASLGSHTETPPGGTISGQSQTISPNLP